MYAVPSVMGRGPPGPRSPGLERQSGNGHTDVRGRDSDTSTGKPQPREMTAASRARTAGRPRRGKGSDSDGEVDQSDLSESTHRRQASTGPSNGRRHLGRTKTGNPGRNRKDIDFWNWADPERPNTCSRRDTDRSKGKMANRFRREFLFVVAARHVSRIYSIAQMFLEA